MNNLEIGFLGIGCVLLLILLRFHIGIAMGLVSLIGIASILNVDAALGMISAVPFRYVGDWNLSAIPMFLLMGFIAGNTGLTDSLFSAMRILLSRLPGGLAIATVGASALFAAASGSSVATAASMSRIAVPEMLKSGYDKGLATASVAASGTLGSLIPPSILLLLFGFFAEVSVGQLFLAGFLPGVLSVVLYAAMIYVRCALNPALAPTSRDVVTWEAIVGALKSIWPLPTLVLFVLVGIFSGLFTPTQAGAVGTVIATLIALLRGSLTFTALKASVASTIASTASIFLVVIGTVFLTRFLALSQIPTFLTQQFISLDAGPILIIVMIAVIYILLGMFVDSIGLMLLTMPIFIPVAVAADMNLIWLGIIIVKLLEIGLVTPPVGLNIYVIKSSLGSMVNLGEIFRGVSWFILMDVITLAILVAFPVISLLLPNLLR
jgi:tripartite ATP-independent transporter DctM subunit